MQPSGSEVIATEEENGITNWYSYSLLINSHTYICFYLHHHLLMSILSTIFLIYICHRIISDKLSSYYTTIMIKSGSKLRVSES